jgi:DNA-binding NarL/FixJ family response regulator
MAMMEEFSGEGLESVPRVLLVDDDPFFVEALWTLLAPDERIKIMGSAGDGAEALALTEELRPDVVLMDIHMPVMDGLEATRRIRASFPGTRVVFLTSSSSKEIAEEAFLAGADGFLTKDSLGGGLIEVMLGVVREHGTAEQIRCKFPATTASLRTRALHTTPQEALLSPMRRPRDPEAASVPPSLRPQS